MNVILLLPHPLSFHFSRNLLSHCNFPILQNFAKEILLRLVFSKITTIFFGPPENFAEIIVRKSGKYSVTIIDANGCKTSDSVNINFVPIPDSIIDVIGKTDFCVGDSVWLESRYDYQKYEWYKDSESAPFANQKKILIKESGNYYLKSWNNSGCSSISNSVKVTVRLDTNYSISLLPQFRNSISIQQKFPAIICKKLKLRSLTWKTQIIDNIYLYRNLSFSIPQSMLPIVLEPYGE